MPLPRHFKRLRTGTRTQPLQNSLNMPETSEHHPESLELDRAPGNVTNEALWVNGDTADPHVGDLWILTWDGNILGLAILSSVSETYVLGWPVTLDGASASSPSIPVDSPLGLEVATWPTRLTGFGKHLLHRRLGSLISPETVSEVEVALESECSPPIDFAPPPSDLSESFRTGERMIVQWADICFHQWPTATSGKSPLSHDFLIENSVLPSDLARHLNIRTDIASAIHRGNRVPTQNQLDSLSSAYQVPSDALIAPNMDDGAKQLLQPDLKDRILEVARKRNLDEGSTRDGIQSEYALAARSNGTRADLMSAAINRFESAEK